MEVTMNYRSLSLWWDQLPENEISLQRPSAQGTLEADVAIVGAGFTGLWTAYWLKKLNPQIDVAVIEAEVVGFGASGRNGGWCSALFPASLDKIAAASGRESAIAMHSTMQHYIAHIGKTLADEGIDCDWHHGGDIYLTRTAPHIARAKAELAHWREWGFSDEDHRWLDASAAQERFNASSVLGATFTPHCARINPAKLVRGLAHVIERMGVRVFEHSRALTVEPHVVTGHDFVVHAKTVVRATEGYTAQLPRRKREVVPVYSLMVATEPLSDAQWNEIGLAQRELFADYRHLIIYGQRTADNRIAFGGRGAPYHFGSAISPKFDRHASVHAGIKDVLRELLPQLRDVAFTHEWGGPLGIPRDWYPSITVSDGLATAGGYVGDGVATSALAGHTLAELLLGHDTERTRLPWVNRTSPKWEVEPLRWIGANAGLRMMTVADIEERITQRPSKLAAVFDKVTGR
jgi:glycine/D-amino acid oxidase-like deaminating enzyme